MWSEQFFCICCDALLIFLIRFDSCVLLARDDLKSRMESKSPLAQYLGSLYDASAAFMLLNPASVQILLRYMSSLCGHLSRCEAAVLSPPGGRGASAATKDAKTRLMKLQQEVEKVGHLLVTVGKHSPRSFTEVAGKP